MRLSRKELRELQGLVDSSSLVDVDLSMRDDGARFYLVPRHWPTPRWDYVQRLVVLMTFCGLQSLTFEFNDPVTNPLMWRFWGIDLRSAGGVSTCELLGESKVTAVCDDMVYERVDDEQIEARHPTWFQGAWGCDFIRASPGRKYPPLESARQDVLKPSRRSGRMAAVEGDVDALRQFLENAAVLDVDFSTWTDCVGLYLVRDGFIHERWNYASRVVVLIKFRRVETMRFDFARNAPAEGPWRVSGVLATAVGREFQCRIFGGPADPSIDIKRAELSYEQVDITSLDREFPGWWKRSQSPPFTFLRPSPS